MAWYRVGSCSLTNGSKVVTGSGTAWAANVQSGDAFHAPDGKTYEIDFVGSDASLNLVDSYTGTTASGQSYKIQPTQGRVRDLAAAVSTLIAEYGSIEAALTVASGSVGINATPTNTLTVGGSFALNANSTTDVLKGYSGGAGLVYLGTTTSTSLAMIAGGGEFLRGLANGNVGIGTSAPATKLEVSGASARVRVSGTSGTLAALELSSAGIVNWSIRSNNSGTGDFALYQDATERWRVGSAGNFGINCVAHASALLDVQATDRGLRLPNMTTAQKNAIASPAAGLMVFDTTLAKACLYTGAAWQTITST